MLSMTLSQTLLQTAAFLVVAMSDLIRVINDFCAHGLFLVFGVFPRDDLV